MVEGNGELNHPLDVAAEVLTRGTTPGTVSRQAAPHVFENFVGVEKASAVEEVEALAEVVLILVG
jgi:hypothetical protein